VLPPPLLKHHVYHPCPPNPATQEDSRVVVAGLRSNLAFDSISAGEPGSEILTLDSLKSGLQFQQWCVWRPEVPRILPMVTPLSHLA
jgi:hypothetical protein